MAKPQTPEQPDELIILFLSGHISPEDQALLETWIAADEAHLHHFRQLRDAWLSGGYEAGTLYTHPDAAWNNLVPQLQGPLTTTGGPLRIRRTRRFFQVAATIALPFIIGGGVMYGWMSRGTASTDQFVTVTSPKGATTRIELSDGTEVWLNAGSKLQYAQSYNQQKREVKLEGEAFFEVKTNPQKPFTVNAADLRIQALGTSFNVKAYPEDKTVETTLVDGMVKIDGSRAASPFNMMLKPHQNVVYRKPAMTAGNNHKKGQPAVSAEQSATPVESREVHNTDLYTAWKDGSWIFSAQSLEELAVTMGRKFNVQVVFENEELKQYKFSGTFRQETLEQVLNILKLTAPLKYDINNGVVTLQLDQVLKEHYSRALPAAK